MNLTLHLISLAGWGLLALWISRARNDLPYDRHFTTAIALIVTADIARTAL